MTRNDIIKRLSDYISDFQDGNLRKLQSKYQGVNSVSSAAEMYNSIDRDIEKIKRLRTIMKRSTWEKYVDRNDIRGLSSPLFDVKIIYNLLYGA